MDAIKVPEGLPGLVSERFQEAKKAGDVLFWDSDVALLHMNGIPFQLRYCPALKSKPKAVEKAPGEKPFNPFLDPPKELIISDIGDSYILVLNKFALVANHFILATKAFARQIEPFVEADLATAYAIINAYKDAGERLFGFFNCGKHSGASQPHRHIQFFPIDNMRAGLEGAEQSWEPLTDRLMEDQAKIPFTYISAPIPKKVTPKKLHDTYMALYKLACYAVEKYAAQNPGEGMELDRELEKTGGAPISYNLAFTDKMMVILPRRTEGMAIPTGLKPPQPQETGLIELNGTVLGGTLLVKDKLEWDALRDKEGGLQSVLERIGIPFSAFQSEILGWKAVVPNQSL